MKLALYKRPGNSPAHWAAHIITCVVVTVRDSFRKRKFTPCKYSHAELVINDISYSSSARDKGVRRKRIAFDEQWDIIEITNPLVLAEPAKTWFDTHKGEGYDWAGVFSWGLRFIKQAVKRWFCFEACAAMMGMSQPDRASPADLIEWATRK